MRRGKTRTLGCMTTNRAHSVIAGALLLGGAALHGYEHVILSTHPDAWSYLWSLLPYVLCLIVLVLSASAIPTIAGISVALAIDALVHYEVFVSPKGYTVALALLFV